MIRLPCPMRRASRWRAAGWCGSVTLGAVVLGLLAAGCAATGDDPGAATASTAGSGGTAGAGGAASAGAGSGAGGNGIEPGPDGLHCSADLRSIVDGDGVLVETCPPTEGCLDNECVPACQAAAASKGSVGCDFVIATPDFFGEDGVPGATSPCFAVFIANNWTSAVQIQVSRGGQALDPKVYGRVASDSADPATWPALPATGLAPNQVAVLLMSRDASTNYQCPTEPLAVDGSTAVTGTGRGEAFHVSTDLPVTTYDILPFGGATSFLPSAELVLPTTAWGTNYMLVVPPLGNSDFWEDAGPQWAQVVAAENDTTVIVAPTVALPGGPGIEPAPANAATTFTLDAGEFIQWDPAGEISGTVIAADKPVAATGGNAYLCLTSATSTSGGCDSAHQQIPPVTALGWLYAVSPYASRMSPAPESVPYRIMATVAGTTLSYDPPVPGAPLTLGAGEVADFEATTAFVVQSQGDTHPFYVGQMMTGCGLTGGSGLCTGDEEFVNVLPPTQYLSRYAFFTDPTYKTTSLVITRQKTKNGFEDVEIDCLGQVQFWQPIGESGEYEYATPYLLDNGKPKNGCANGPHRAWSKGPFGLTVWGTASYASYAYPAGGNAAAVNRVVIPPPK
jgi:hypothetical protein